MFLYIYGDRSIYIETQNGKIVKAEWKNPAVITNIDNDNAQIKQLEEIKEIFLKQMDYMLSDNMTALIEDKGIVLNRRIRPH